MKEADIAFGELYAIEPYEGQGRGKEPLCMVVVRKAPPKAGASRSRMYICRTPDDHAERLKSGSVGGSGNHVDASKILMPWSEYEKTPEYAERHAATVTKAMNDEVWRAMQEWGLALESFVQAAIPKSNGSKSYVSVGSPNPNDSVELMVERAMGRPVQTDISAIVTAAGFPLPDTSRVKTAIETRDETVAQVTRQLLPYREAKLRRELDVEVRSQNVRVWFLSHEAMLSEFVDDLILTETEGPHKLLVDLATAMPYNRWLKDLTENQMFRYLIPYLDFDPI